MHIRISLQLRLLLIVSMLVISPLALSLSLGDIELQSPLGMPLKARLLLSNFNKISVEELRVSLASESQYQHFKLKRHSSHYDLGFSIKTDTNGQTYLHIAGRRPVNEPYLNFVIFLQWPKGELLKEVTVLFDAPPIDTLKQ